jgi:hypothetical protein
MDLVFRQENSGTDTVDRSVAPSLVKEASVLVELVEEVRVGLASPEIEVTNLKVRPEMTAAFSDEQSFSCKPSNTKNSPVVALAAIIAEELHCVILGNMLGMLLHEGLGTLPESRDGLDVLVERQREPVLLVVVLHVFEDIVVDVAVKLNGGFHSPVVFVVQHELLLEKETRLKAAHVTVGNGISVNDTLCVHVLANLFCLLLIDVIGEAPVLLGDEPILRLSAHKRRSNLLEIIVERFVVQENPVVMELAVETVLYVTNRLCDLPDVLVASKGDESGIGPLAREGFGQTVVRLGSGA